MSKQKEGEKKMNTIALVIFVWVFAVICVCIMKKIQPENKIYPVWVVFVCIMLTAFVGYHESWWTAFR